MKRISVLLAGLILLCGCWSSDKPKPQPKPGPQPPESACNVVIVVDEATETPAQAGVYCDATLRAYLEKGGHELRIISPSVVAEGKTAPAYLQPYLAEAKKHTPPVVVTGRKGVTLAAFALPATAQALIDQVDRAAYGSNSGDANTFWAGGDRRRLGCLPLRAGAEKRWPTEGSRSNEPLVPRSAWRDIDCQHLAAPTMDQDGYSCCCACATDGCLISARNRAGLKPVELSVVDCYARGNGGRDQGMTLEDGVAIAMQGVCSTQYAAMWGVTKTQHKSGYQEDRLRNRVLMATWCPTADHVGSALQRCRPVVFGTMVGTGFTPDANGVIGPKQGNPRGGHALYLVGAKQIAGQWYFRVVNSWGKDWGQAGRAWIHESWIDPAFGAWAIASVASPSDEPLPAARAWLSPIPDTSRARAAIFASAL